MDANLGKAVPNPQQKRVKSGLRPASSWRVYGHRYRNKWRKEFAVGALVTDGNNVF
jgi:hypothetical protein